MALKLTILGCHSATPRMNAHPTSQFLEINNRFFLIDCGEGTQTLLRKHKISFSKISHIFISHLHGDHVFGLIGLICTFSLNNRMNDLYVIGPKGIKELILTQIKLSGSYTKFNLYFQEIEAKESVEVFQDEKVSVQTIPLNHRIYTNGYLFVEKHHKRRLNKDAVQQYVEIETCDYNKLKLGEDYILSDGTVLDNKKLTYDPPAPLKYAYCSDTSYREDIIQIIQNADLLYHESTFLKTHESLAKMTGHSTAEQAALIAKKAAVKHLILGHYSARYKDLNLFLDEAKTHFEMVSLGESGKTFKL